MTEEDANIQEAAIAFAKAKRREIVARLTDTTKFPGEDLPVSVFMAGSPGAGKTEASIELLDSLDGPPALRIDPDELRSEFPGYTGGNAWLFQRAVTVIVERVHDIALKQRQSFLLDGTLSNYNIAENNINRSLRKGRPVQILYVYQEPLLAWRFAQVRELKEGRGIRPATFVDQYFAAGARKGKTMFGLFGKELTTVKETSLSRFIREASSADKKRIYSEVLRKATDRQLKVLEEVGRDRHASAGGEK